MTNILTIERLSFGTIYKLVFVGLLWFLVPFSTLMGTLALFGAGTVTWNGQPLTGFSGLVASPFIGIFVSVFFTLILGTMIVLGLWLYSKHSSLDIAFIGAEGRADD